MATQRLWLIPIMVGSMGGCVLDDFDTALGNRPAGGVSSSGGNAGSGGAGVSSSGAGGAGGSTNMAGFGGGSSPDGGQNPVVEALWAESRHALESSPAFRHWDDNEGQVTDSCARCHTSAGFVDYVQDRELDSSVSSDESLGIDCEACHSDVADNLTRVRFPSEVEITGLGPEAVCMACHQGRASTKDVQESIQEASVANDEVGSMLSFQNVHESQAGATLLGAEVRGGYQYSGKNYNSRFTHTPGFDVCQGCHDPHSLAVELDDCATCHSDVHVLDDVKRVRGSSSQSDYDGDGNTYEGIFGEVDGLRKKLYTALQRYAATKVSDKICYDPQFPFFFVDSNGSGGECDDSEASFSNRYESWTPRLLRAAYNLRYLYADRGAYAHNGKYILQLLFDSISDLNVAISSPVDMSKAIRPE